MRVEIAGIKKATAHPVQRKCTPRSSAILFVAVTMGIAAALSGSSSPSSSEAVHSLVDCGNEVLLLYGQRRAGASAGPPKNPPFGYGRELYSLEDFVVALLIFRALARVVSIYQRRLLHILEPEHSRSLQSITS